MLIGSLARVRANEREDLPRYVAWLNDPELRSHLLAFAPLSLADEERWFERIAGEPAVRVFAIDRKADDGGWLHVGGCGIEDIDQRNGSARVGLFLGDPRERGRGVGTEAMRLLLDFAFGELRLHRVELEVFEDNARARGVYERLGFVVEGTRRESLWKGGRWLSPVVMSLLAQEWLRSSSS